MNLNDHITKFLSKPIIAEFLNENALTAVYFEFGREEYIYDSDGSIIHKSNILTEFFLANGIEPLNYVPPDSPYYMIIWNHENDILNNISLTYSDFRSDIMNNWEKYKEVVEYIESINQHLKNLGL